MSDQPVEHLEIKNKRRRRILKKKGIVDETVSDDSIQLLVKDEIPENIDSPDENNSLSNFDLKPLKKEKQLMLKVFLNIWTLLLGVIFIATFVISTYHDRKIDPSNVKTTLILFSLDAFRREYLDRKKTPTLATMAEEGISAEYMISQFPTKTFPNHYSIITGLYPESHGIVSNVFYDPKLNSTFRITDPECYQDHENKWFKGEPLWATANKNGHKTASLMWVGSQAVISGEKPTYVVPYGDMTLDERMDAVFEWLELPAKDRPSFISVYVPDLDTIGHQKGPSSDDINRKLVEIDQMFAKFLTKLEDRELIDFIDIMVVSDHGMSDTDPEKVLFLDDYIDLDDVEVTDVYPIGSIRPKNGTDINKIYEKWSSGRKNGNETLFNVWFTNENLGKQEYLIPERFHYNSLINERIPPIVSAPKPPYTWATKDSFNKDSFLKGLHGYENTEEVMKAIFLAKGPSFQKKVNFTMEPFANTELYDVMCRILKIKPAPNNSTANGRALFDKVLNI